MDEFYSWLVVCFGSRILFFSTADLYHFFNPSLRNLVYPDYELLTCFPSVMFVTAPTLQNPTSICCRPHRCVQDQTWQWEHLAPRISCLNHLLSFICHGEVSICLFSPFYHLSGFTSSFPLYQCGKLVASGCFIPLISFPTLIPHHWLIQFPTIHLLPFISFLICCTMTPPLLPLPLSLQNSIPLWIWIWDPSLRALHAAPSSAPVPALSPLTPSPPTHPSRLSSGYSLLIHTIVPLLSNLSIDHTQSYDYFSNLGSLSDSTCIYFLIDLYLLVLFVLWI